MCWHNSSRLVVMESGDPQSRNITPPLVSKWIRRTFWSFCLRNLPEFWLWTQQFRLPMKLVSRGERMRTSLPAKGWSLSITPDMWTGWEDGRGHFRTSLLSYFLLRSFAPCFPWSTHLFVGTFPPCYTPHGAHLQGLIEIKRNHVTDSLKAQV